MFLLAGALGAIGGLAAIGFQRLTDLVRRLSFALFGVPDRGLLGSAASLAWWEALLMPTLGAAVAALLLFVVFRRRGSYGIADVMEVVSLRKGEVRLDNVLSRSIATAAVIGSGGSTGREGPIIQIGSAIASWAGRVARLPPRELSVLIACGAAAGMAGAYNAPIGAAMFVMEVILGSFVMEQFAPVMVSSVLSTLTVRALQGGAPVYTVPALSVGSPWEAGPIFVLGILSALVGWLFLHALEWFEDGLHALRLPRGLLAVTGGLLVGAMGIALPEVWGNGFDAVSERILPVAMPVGMLALLMVAKTVATGITSGSGISGGVFTPTLFVGAALGAAFGGLVQHVVPGANPSLYALLGMGSVLAATTHAPLMAILILFEMTHDPPLIAPLMLGTVTATLFARWIRSDSLYTARLKRRGVRLPEGAEEAALLRTYARDLVRTDAPVLPARAPLARVLDVFLNSRRGALYVVGDGGRYEGVARIHDVKAVFGTSSEEAGGIVAIDVAVPLPAVAEDEAIGTVLARFSDQELDEVPVVASATDPRFVGSLSRRDILAMLRHEVLVEPQRPARATVKGPEGPAYLELPAGWGLTEVPVAPADVGAPVGDGRWREGGRVPLVVLRPDGHGGRSPLPPSGTPLQAGDVVLVLGPHP